jgi:transposase
MTSKTTKTYTEKFKAAAVKLVAEGKQSAPEASRSLGIGESTLYKWIDQHKPSDEKDSKSIKVNDELIWLRTEVVELKKKLALTEEHREFLKKAAYFAAGQGYASTLFAISSTFLSDSKFLKFPPLVAWMNARNNDELAFASSSTFWFKIL